MICDCMQRTRFHLSIDVINWKITNFLLDLQRYRTYRHHCRQSQHRLCSFFRLSRQTGLSSTWSATPNCLLAVDNIYFQHAQPSAWREKWEEKRKEICKLTCWWAPATSLPRKGDGAGLLRWKSGVLSTAKLSSSWNYGIMIPWGELTSQSKT